MSKIYVITAGEYSDYQIYGVTTNPERAEAMRKIVDAHFRGHGDAMIEEFEDGVFEDERMSTIVPTEYYRVWLRTGSDEIKAHPYYGEANADLKVTRWPYRDVEDIIRNGYSIREVGTEYFVTGIRADSEEQAIKIAVDKVTKYMVEKGELGQ